jgi:hypothetical protein
MTVAKASRSAQFGATFSMSSSHSLDSVVVTFDDDRLVANAGLIAPATLAQHLGLRELFDEHVQLGDAPGRANVGDKAMTVTHSVLAGGDSIDDYDALRAGATQAVLGHTVLAPSTIGVSDQQQTVLKVAIQFVDQQVLAKTSDGRPAEGQSYVSDNAMTRTTTSTTTKAPTIPIHVGTAPTEIAITPDGTTAYVVNQGDNTVTPISWPPAHRANPSPSAPGPMRS